MTTNSSEPDKPASDRRDEHDSTDGAAGPRISRRRTLRAGGMLGTGGLLGLASLGVDRAAAACSDPEEILHLDYDAVEDWTDFYRVSNGDADNLALVSSPTSSGDRALQMRIREGDNWGVSTHYDFEDGVIELNGRVDFALNTGWSMPGRRLANCRLWNCAIARGPGSAGGGTPDGTNGWSNRMYVTTRDADPEGPYHLLSNTYHMGEGQGEYGEQSYIVDGEPNALATPQIVPGRWYEFEYYVRVNTVSGGSPNPDGVVRYWLDGDPIYERENLQFTTDRENNAIETTGPVGHYGGSYTAPQNLYAYYDDHSMAIGGAFDPEACDP